MHARGLLPVLALCAAACGGGTTTEATSTTVTTAVATTTAAQVGTTTTLDVGVQPLETLGDDEVVALDIARSDDAVAAIAGPDWNAATISPTYRDDPDDPSGAVVEIELAAPASYAGPWPNAGCKDGELRGAIYDVDARDIATLQVGVDFTFGRVTNLTALAADGGEPVISFGDELTPGPYYDGACSD